MENKKSNGAPVFRFDSWRVSVLTSMLLRLEYSGIQQFEDRASQIVVNRTFPETPVTVEESAEQITFITEDSRVMIRRDAFQFSAIAPCTGEVWQYGQKLHNFGGTARTLDEADGAIPLEDGLFSEEGISILKDDSYLIDGDKIISRSEGSKDFYIFLYGRNFSRGIRDFYRLTGDTPLLPKYALGNWWSRYWAYTQQEYLELMDRFEKENVPLSVAVLDMNWHLTKVPEGCEGWTGFTWDRSLFPNRQDLLNKLHKKGLKVTLNLHPAGGVQPFEEAYPACAEAMGATDGKTIPFDFTDKKFRDMYFDKLLHPMEKEGVDFWWIDWQQGTKTKLAGMDPLWLLNHYQYRDHIDHGTTPLILSRYAGPGSHRYPIGFSGDSVVSWDSLRFQPYFTATASNIGYGWWSHDIGGHLNGFKDDELIARWVQLGVFSPITRLHSARNPFGSKEPWNHRGDICEIIKKFLRLRRHLMPYLYTMNWISHSESTPIVRPLYHIWPEQDKAYHMPNEFAFGTQMLAAPITEPCESKSCLASVPVWLPEETYYDFFTGLRYRGNRAFTAYRHISDIPVFVKAGAIVPTEETAEALTLRIYPGADGQFAVSDENAAGQRIASEEIELRGNRLTILNNTEEKNYEICWIGEKVSAAEVLADGRKTDCRICYDASAHLTRISVPKIQKEAVLTVLEAENQQKAIRLDLIENLLREACTSMDIKRQVYEKLQKELSLPEDCREMLKQLIGRTNIPAPKKQALCLQLDQDGRLPDYFPENLENGIREIIEA